MDFLVSHQRSGHLWIVSIIKSMIRKANFDDYEGIWEIFHKVIQKRDTYVFDPNTPREDLQKHWFAPYMHTYVFEEGGKVLGTYIVKPNQIDLGSHIANASYMVHPMAQGKGIGKQMGEHSLNLARELGFIGMQFNIVISTNEAALRLWKKLGFEIIGTTPKGFQSANGLVDTHIMYITL